MIFYFLNKLAVINIIFLLLLSGLTPAVDAETTDQKTENTGEPEPIPNDEPTMIVKGHVLDKNNNMGIPKAFLLFFNDYYKSRSSTNDEGFFIIELPAGSYRVFVDADGYMEIRDEIAGRPDQIIRVDYYLTPGEPEPPPDEKPPLPDDGEKSTPIPDDDNRDDIIIEKGTEGRNIADMFGGGGSVVIRSGNEKDLIAVIYGTRDNPNSITILAYYTRYIGAGDIYDSNSGLLEKNKPITVKTMYMQTFENIIEYNDTNSDGLFNNFDRTYDNNINPPMDIVYKKVSLRTAWFCSDITEQSFRDNNKEYQFELTTKNLKYQYLDIREDLDRQGILEIIRFNFHVYIKRDPTTRNDIPAFRIEVEAGDDGNIHKVSSASFEEFRVYEGRRTATKVKYDYTIAGWDFDRMNDAQRLFMDMKVAMLHSSENPIVKFMNMMHFDEAFRFQDRFLFKDSQGLNNEFVVQQNDGENYELIEEKEKTDTSENTRTGKDENLIDDNLPQKEYEEPVQIEDNQLKFIDNIYQLGSFSWVSNVTVDGKNMRIKFQIQRIALAKKYFNEQTFMGFEVKGGFSLPAGNRIFHDPTFASDFYEMNIISESQNFDGKETGGVMTVSVFIMLIIIAIILVAFYASVNAMKDKKMSPPKLPNNNIYTVMGKDKFERKKKSEEDEYYESYYVDWDD